MVRRSDRRRLNRRSPPHSTMWRGARPFGKLLMTNTDLELVDDDEESV